MSKPEVKTLVAFVLGCLVGLGLAYWQIETGNAIHAFSPFGS